jgi:hypothetical protein
MALYIFLNGYYSTSGHHGLLPTYWVPRQTLLGTHRGRSIDSQLYPFQARRVSYLGYGRQTDLKRQADNFIGRSLHSLRRDSGTTSMREPSCYDRCRIHDPAYVPSIVSHSVVCGFLGVLGVTQNRMTAYRPSTTIRNPCLQLRALLVPVSLSVKQNWILCHPVHASECLAVLFSQREINIHK